jgi:MGT family glycosyltransferase
MQNKKSYLFVTIEGGGNTTPVLAVARKLQSQGHQVHVLTEPCMEELVRSAELGFIPFHDYFTRTDRTEDIFQDWKPSSPLKDPVIDRIVLGPAVIVAKATLQALEQTNADTVVADCLLPGAVMAAERLKKRSIILFHMPEYFPGPNRPPGIFGLLPGKGVVGRLRDRLLGRAFHAILNMYLSRLNRFRDEWGLPKISRTADLFHRADLRIIQTLRDFDFPLEPAPANVRYTGPVLDDPDWAGNGSMTWLQDDDRPLVVISLSSTFQNQSKVIQNAIMALEDMHVRGIVTLGPALLDNGFIVPDHVHVVKTAPHSMVFPKADLVITHAGHGTVMRALANGLPLVCVPMGRDQNDNAAKVAWHGCGIRLGSKSSPRKIRKAVSKVLHDPAFRERAAKFQQAIHEYSEKDLLMDVFNDLYDENQKTNCRTDNRQCHVSDSTH